MIDSPARAKAIASELLAGAQMSDEVVRARLRDACDRGYWLRAAPALSIGGAPQPWTRTLTPPDLDATVRRFGADGYFQLPPIIDHAALAQLNVAIDAVVGAGWPPVFAWAYDQFWSLSRLPDVSDLLTRALGAAYSQIPHIWTHVVSPVVGASGWGPHFDFASRGRVSVWLALSDATLTNGCMHVVTATDLAAGFAARRPELERIVVADALRALKGVRALPVSRGAALGWGAGVLHWGGPCLQANQARRAISMEFIAPTVAPDPDESPLLPHDGPLPAFGDRLRMIATAVLAYENFEPGLIRYRALAERLRSTDLS